MTNYYIRSGNTLVEINTSTEVVTLVVNVPTQQTISIISNNPNYYNTVVSASVSWVVTDQTNFDTNKSIVLQSINNS